MQINKRVLALAVAAALSTQIGTHSSAADAATGKPVGSAGHLHNQPHFKFPSHAQPNVSTVLYDQSGIAENGAPVQDFQSAFDPYDSQAADDFVVTDATGWNVSAFNFEVLFADQNGNPTQPPPGIVYDVDIYADAAGFPGTTACTYSGVTGTVDPGATNLSITLPSPCGLPQGTYWLSFTPVLDYPPQSFWSNASGSAIGAEAVWRNPGGGFATACSAWSEVSTCTTSSAGVIGGGNPNFLFQVIGSVGINSGCQPGGICLTSTVGTDLSPGACAAADAIDAIVGNQLNFCYTVTNNTGLDLDYHSLSNNIDGALLNEVHQTVAPGASYQFNHIETVGATNTYNATWTAQDQPSGYLATVEIGGGNCADRIFADGFDGVAAPCTGSNFVDITGTGAQLSLSDDGSVDVSMPFSFNFYGTTSNILTVANNGAAVFNTPGAFVDYLNVSLPSGALPGPAMLPLWDDFDTESGQVYTDTRGAAPDRQFIVEWFDRVHYDGTANTDGATFELILNENGAIQFEYADVEYSAINNFVNDPDDCTGGVCATIGLQNDTSLFNQFAAFQAALTDNSGILWTPASPQIFTSSDTVTVNVGAPKILVNPNPIAGTVATGTSTTIPFAIENHGDRDLDWTLDEAAPSILHFPPPGTRFVMPLGDPVKVSAARAPIAHGAKKMDHGKSFHPPFVNAIVPTFAADIFQDNIETFDALASQTVNIVAPITGGIAYVGGAFIGGDFSKLYAIAGNFGGNPDDFFTIDTITGTPSLIGSATNNLAEGYAGLASDGLTGNLYAASSNCGTSSHLWTLDPTNGAPTAVGEIIGAPCIVAIAVDPLGEMYGLDIATDSLYAIDKTTGNAQAIGSIGFNANYAQDMAFDLSTGILYLAGFDGDAGTDSIYTIDLATGLATIIAPIGSTLGEVDAMGIETLAGPCFQPLDLPWLSLSPSSGTTPPSSSTPITATIDATMTPAGTTLSGTVCATSNDPYNHTVGAPITVNVVTPPTPPSVSKTFNPTQVTPGTTSTLTLTLANTNATDATLSAPLVDAFPGGLVIADTPNATTTCGGNVTAAPAAGSVTLDVAGAAIPANGSCTISVDVVAGSPSDYANDIPAGALQTSEGANTVPADATLSVAFVPPTLAKAFVPGLITLGSTSTLVITLGNPNGIPVSITSSLIDPFPNGLVVDAVPNAQTTCVNGSVTAVGGDVSVALDGPAVIPAGGTCTVTIDVTSASVGVFDNSIPADSLHTAAGSNATSADATLKVTP